MSNQFHDPDIDERLSRAACADHPYDRTCGVCVHRYLDKLIEDNYVARWLHDDTMRSLHAAEAMVKSLRVELAFTKEQVEFWKRSKVFQGQYPIKEREANDITWDPDENRATYEAELAYLNGHTICICLNDEGPITPAFYWNIDDVRGWSDEHQQWMEGWAGSVRQARHDAVNAARTLSRKEKT